MTLITNGFHLTTTIEEAKTMIIHPNPIIARGISIAYNSSGKNKNWDMSKLTDSWKTLELATLDKVIEIISKRLCNQRLWCV